MGNRYFPHYRNFYFNKRSETITHNMQVHHKLLEPSKYCISSYFKKHYKKIYYTRCVCLSVCWLFVCYLITIKWLNQWRWFSEWGKTESKSIFLKEKLENVFIYSGYWVLSFVLINHCCYIVSLEFWRWKLILDSDPTLVTI